VGATRELVEIFKASARLWGNTVPREVLRRVQSMALKREIDADEMFGIVGDAVMAYLDDLGPVYGKISQVTLSRFSGEVQSWLDLLHVNRIYGKWPPLSSEEIEGILDSEFADWRTEFAISEVALGVASMAQVVGFTDLNGGQWVCKIIKPKARQRMFQTVKALERLIAVSAEVGSRSTVVQRSTQEVGVLLQGMMREANLLLEAENIERIRAELKERKRTGVRIPKLHPRFKTASALVMERFSGRSLAEIVSGRISLDERQKKALAEKALYELLVQIFEIGVFHGDPHAGNLMLLDDGSLGLFDWGLAGELQESDRKHIAEILKSVLTKDIDRLSRALQSMANEGGVEIDEGDIQRELKKLTKMFALDAKKPFSVQESIKTCLKSAEKLEIPIPNGLLMMAKALVTVEGLSRGIYKDIPLGKVAAPVLLRVARPSVGDFFRMARATAKSVFKKD
jgi:ubiquinone biosynthesis protein